MGDIRNRPKVYEAKLAPTRISQELKDAIANETQRTGATESDVVRAWLDVGRKDAAKKARKDANAHVDLT